MTALFQISKGLMYDRTCNSIKSEQNTGVNTREPFQKYILQDVNWLKLNEPSLIKIKKKKKGSNVADTWPLFAAGYIIFLF